METRLTGLSGLISGIIFYILFTVLIIYLINNYLSTYISKDKLPRLGYFLLLSNLILIYIVYVFRNLITINIDSIKFGIMIIMNSIISYLAINKDKNTWNAIKAQIIISSILSIGRLVYMEQYNGRFSDEYISTLIEQINKNKK